MFDEMLYQNLFQQRSDEMPYQNLFQQRSVYELLKQRHDMILILQKQRNSSIYCLFIAVCHCMAFVVDLFVSTVLSIKLVFGGKSNDFESLKFSIFNIYCRMNSILQSLIGLVWLPGTPAVDAYEEYVDVRVIGWYFFGSMEFLSHDIASQLAMYFNRFHAICFTSEKDLYSDELRSDHDDPDSIDLSDHGLTRTLSRNTRYFTVEKNLYLDKLRSDPGSIDLRDYNPARNLFRRYTSEYSDASSDASTIPDEASNRSNTDCNNDDLLDHLEGSDTDDGSCHKVNDSNCS